MLVDDLHAWNVTPAEGRALQERLAPRVRLEPLPRRPELVAGADMSFSKQHGVFFASVIVLRLPELEVVEKVAAHHEPTFPYVPGLLTFREGPVLLAAIRKLEHVPDVFIFDGQGIAHPRRMGLAAHMGLWLSIPTLGCAKSRLTGTHADPGPKRGCSTRLLDHGEQIGTVLCTRDGVKPVFVSPGHLADFSSSTRLVLSCCTRYRLPEPTRLADIEVARVKRDYLEAHGLLP
ncbi:MAG TPA: deoxyribonuclease V [Myxococcota bacterium]|nr:deoxyribonuclease V [Myxococcota bacterium]